MYNMYISIYIYIYIYVYVVYNIHAVYIYTITYHYIVHMLGSQGELGPAPASEQSGASYVWMCIAYRYYVFMWCVVINYIMLLCY